MVGTLSLAPSDHTIRIWDAQTGAPVGELKGHTGWVKSVAYSPDGRNIVSCSYDNTIRVWEAQANLVEGELCMLHISASGLILLLSDDRITLSQSRQPHNDRIPVNAFSGLPIPAEMIDSNGWVHNKEGLLFWVPEDCRHGLTCPAILTIPNTGRQRTVRIDFSRFHYGTSWTNIRGSNAGEQL